MSLYFFSESKVNDEHYICALAGVKSIVLSPDVAASIEKKLTLDTRNYYNLLCQSLKEHNLDEELNHFDCLSKSFVAFIFHLRNFLLRLSYTNCLNKDINKLTKKSAIIYKTINYFIEYASFHTISYGYIEAHHQILTDNETIEERSLYKDDIIKAMHNLKSSNNLKNLDELTSKTIDSMFFSKLFGGNIFWGVFTLLKHQIFDVHALPLMLRTLFNHFGIVIPYLFGRLFFKKIKTTNTGVLPGIISHNITIDPVAFTENKQSLNSQETPIKNHHDSKKAMFAWYLIKTAVTIFTLIENKQSKNQIVKYLSMINHFTLTWHPSEIKSEIHIGEIENRLIRLCFEKFRLTKSKKEKANTIFNIYNDTYNHFISDILKEKNDSDLFCIINSSYIHI